MFMQIFKKFFSHTCRDSSLPSRPASIMSLDSFTSAVETSEHPLFELNRENVQEKFILLPSVLLSKYKSHLSQMHCEQWLQNESLTPQTTRKFSLMQNLKVCMLVCLICPGLLCKLLVRSRIRAFRNLFIYID